MFLNRQLGSIAMLWGVAGTVAFLLFPILRMLVHVREAWESDLGIEHYGLAAVWTAFMAYSEGYRGFQKSFSPRVAARAIYLKEKATWLRLLLAPLFCIGLFHATRRKQITVIILMMLIALIVIGFRQIPQPWRGVLDVGVIIGLTWGAVATVAFFLKLFSSKEIEHLAQVVEPNA
ncbi:MAG: hypothetical protein ACE361_23510 [Aureliella sp.]